MRKKLAIALISTAPLWTSGPISASEESETTMTVSKVILAKTEFTDLETIRGVIEGSFASDCLHLDNPVILTAPARIDIQPRAFRLPKMDICHDVFVPWLQTIEIQKLPPGQYLLTLGIAGQPQFVTVKPHSL